MSKTAFGGWRFVDGSLQMQRWRWRYCVAKGINEEAWYATLVWGDRTHPYSSDRFKTHDEACRFCEQHAKAREYWDRERRLAEIARVAPSEYARIIEEAAVAQGLAALEGDEIVWTGGNTMNDLNFEGEGFGDE